MTKVQIEFFTSIETITKEKHHEVTFEGSSSLLRDVMDHIVRRFGHELESAIFKENGTTFRPGVTAAINGRHSVFLKGMDTPLKDGDTVSVGLIGK